MKNFQSKIRSGKEIKVNNFKFYRKELQIICQEKNGGRVTFQGLERYNEAEKYYNFLMS